MYCYKCGSQVSESLKFCNNCGEKLKKGRDEKKQKSLLDELTTTLFLVVMFGLGILVGLVAVLLDNPVPFQLMAITIIAYLVVVFSICLMLLSQIKKVIDAELRDRQSADHPPIDTHVRLSAPDTAQLEEHREPAMSVTDHTTRTLEETAVKRN
jgi:predicted nucleic acid-binding Zn ribbon protein